MEEIFDVTSPEQETESVVEPVIKETPDTVIEDVAVISPEEGDGEVTEGKDETVESKSSEENTLYDEITNYIRGIFGTSHSRDYVSSLSKEDSEYVLGFVDGFGYSNKNNFVGVYDFEYINKFDFPDSLLQALGLNVYHFDVKNKNLNFIVIDQNVTETGNIQ